MRSGPGGIDWDRVSVEPQIHASREVSCVTTSQAKRYLCSSLIVPRPAPRRRKHSSAFVKCLFRIDILTSSNQSRQPKTGEGLMASLPAISHVPAASLGTATRDRLPFLRPNVGFSTSTDAFSLKLAGVTNRRPRFVVSEASRHLVGSVTRTEGLRFAVVVARFNEIVTRLLLEGALDAFTRYSVKDEDIDVVWVPGSFEIPLVAQQLGRSGRYNAIICIGAVVKGETAHYDAVVNSAASGVLSATLNSGVPCIFGILTCDDMDQALNRAGGKSGNKGAEAALTAIEMASLFEHHLKG